MSFDPEELRLGVLEAFSESAQLSRYFCEYKERDAFAFEHGSGASAYRCELCHSMSETHRCIVSDKIPPTGFSCAVPRPLTQRELDRVRIANRERYQQSKRALLSPSLGWPRIQNPCRLCGALAPEHRCPGASVSAA